MKTGLHRDIDILFGEALELDAAEREDFLRLHCTGDDRLRDEISSLLRASEAAGRFLDDAPDSHHRPESVSDSFQRLVGARVGRFEVRELLAVGGMAAVYRALPADGPLECEVALKIIRRDIASPRMVERFHQERRALAALDHPHIARLLDGGTTDDGLPYLVMEYVRGCPIDAYCSKSDLPVGDRLQLFLKVCDAVALANRHLLIHRDLKPANILVTRDGNPKLLDFGIAKLLDEATGQADRTAGIQLLTPGYASPEQFSGRPVSTATDVYSLGVILSELLLGTRRPHDAPGSGASTNPAQPGAFSPAQRRRIDRGDLGAILRKATELRPDDRYPSVELLAADLRRYLNGEVVLARRATLRYRATRFAARNRLSLTLLFTTFVALSTGLVVSIRSMQAARRSEATAQRERQLAIESADRAQCAADFMRELIMMANPYRHAGGFTLADLLADASRTARARFANDPVVLARLEYALGEAYSRLWNWEQARLHAERALALAKEHPGSDGMFLADCLVLHGRALTFSHESAAIDNQRQALQLRRHGLGESHPATAEAKTALAFALWQAQAPPDNANAERLYRESIESLESRSMAPDRRLAIARFSLSALLLQLHRPAEALEQTQRALAIWEKLPETEDYYTFHCRVLQSHALESCGRLADAAGTLSDALSRIPPKSTDESIAREFARLRRLRGED